jgi:hypothetical protein
MLVSERLTREIDPARAIEVDPQPQALDFDAEGNLLPLSALIPEPDKHR